MTLPASTPALSDDARAAPGWPRRPLGTNGSGRSGPTVDGELSGLTWAGLPERRPGRDELLNRLQVVSLPTPPLAAPPISEEDATSASL